MLKNNLSAQQKVSSVAEPQSTILAFKSLFNLIGKDLHQQIHDDAKTYSLTPMQSFIIVYLQDAEEKQTPIYQKDLETLFHVRGSTVTGLLKLMEQKKLLTRHSVPHDARLKEIRLTQKAKKLMARASQKLSQTEDKINLILTPLERKTLLKIINKIKIQLQKN